MEKNLNLAGGHCNERESRVETEVVQAVLVVGLQCGSQTLWGSRVDQQEDVERVAELLAQKPDIKVGIKEALCWNSSHNGDHLTQLYLQKYSIYFMNTWMVILIARVNIWPFLDWFKY